MASFVPLTTTTTTTTFSALSSSPSLKNPLHISTVRNTRHFFKVSCQSSSNNHDQNPASKSTENPLNKFDRRNVLLGIGGYSAATLVPDPLALSAPLSPNLTTCSKPTLPTGATPPDLNCCPPISTKILDFKPPPRPNKLRVRPATHLASDEYVKKFERAVQLMRELPDDDPRSYTQQANIHCAYCNGAYDQVGFPDLELDVHFSWLFFPFHRYYLYFFEKILGKLIDDPTFAIPFWAWDSPASMTMPALYGNPNSSLYNALRDAKHIPETGDVIYLDYDKTDPTTTVPERISENLTIMYRQVVSGGTTAKLFMGSPYRAGETDDPGAGSLENTPHTQVHLWCGDRTQPNVEDMGNFYSAGRDPIFFGHHGNVDRMWSVWKTLGGKRKDFTDSDWLESSFLFYDENAQLVRVKVKDCLDEKNLGYVYQNLDIPWLKSRPTPRVSKASRKIKKAGVAMAADVPPAAQVFPTKLDRVVKAVVARPKKSRTRKQKDDEEEVLLIEGIELDKESFVKFDVFINEDDETATRPGNSEFAGSFVNLPHKHKHGGKGKTKTKTNLRLGITELLEDLGAEDDDGIVVTLVPRSGADNVTVGGAKIEFDS
ncbi:hypothetical protein Vadar_019320 [Vaccinium darrowii]|uniref:Uncharacterized protein n=1 Tax=Vaccinium darrowii TaxID=229202 RepID=A0ACB7X7I8_9ERIC|nr:hypothetical protein Vadar_001774 [Vaccinium darrowii]KAH7864894.1 hypothetical protein Vadar_019320 [Vaccinium darrowii]